MTNSEHSDNFVRIIEVGPRDGLQNESTLLTTEQKVTFINELSSTGVSYIEAGSFVSSRRIPQMASSDLVFKHIQRKPGVTYSALTPNLKGLQGALNANVDEVAVFTAASQMFTQKNINCSIEQSIDRFVPLMEMAKENHIKVRGYVSCVLGCPYQGKVPTNEVIRVACRLLELGCYEVSLGDTIGVGRPHDCKQLISSLASELPIGKLAVHFHDTYGQALANIRIAIDAGIRTVDTSIAGLGGCPYASGATGNVATEDVTYMLKGSGLNTDIDLNKLVQAGNNICRQLNRPNQSKVANAMTVREK